jgi:hypothetical protein
MAMVRDDLGAGAVDLAKNKQFFGRRKHPPVGTGQEVWGGCATGGRWMIGNPSLHDKADVSSGRSRVNFLMVVFSSTLARRARAGSLVRQPRGSRPQPPFALHELSFGDRAGLAWARLMAAGRSRGT